MNKIEASLTGNTIEQSDFGIKNNTDLSVVSEVENYDAYLTANVSTTNGEYDNKNNSEKEEQKTVGYKNCENIF